MSFWNTLRDKASGARAAIASEVAQYRNKTFMEAAVAACAVIAAADGEISSKEKQKMVVSRDPWSDSKGSIGSDNFGRLHYPFSWDGR